MIRKQCLTCRRVYARDKALCPEDGAVLSTILVDSLVGTTLSGRYELLEELGRGGMGVVYKARQEGLDRLVAVKMLLSDLGEDEMSIMRFQSEAKACSGMNHPNVIRVLDYAVSDMGMPYLVMDFHHGVSLYDELKAVRRLALPRAMPIFLQICDALNHAHRRSIVHRDIKSSNIMLIERDGEPDQVILLDFGIAKLFNPGGKTGLQLTKTGEVLGSPLYMSPEQCMGQSLDQRSDLYSFGCLMYEVLTGVAPIRGDSFLNVVFKHLNEEPLPLAEVAPDLAFPGEIAEVIMKCLSKSQEERFADAAALKRELLKAIQNQSAGEDDWSTTVKRTAGTPREGTDSQYLAELKARAQGGDASAQFDLAWDCRMGSNQDADPVMGFYWMSQAANQDYLPAQFELAWLYSAGIGTEPDKEKAFHCYLKAAQQGHAEAQNETGNCYYQGSGVAEDNDLAYYWYQQSAAQGFASAETNLGFFCEQGLVGERDIDGAIAWYKRAVAQGDMYARNYLATLYLDGNGVEQDLPAAVELLQQAAAQGHNFSQYDLAQCFLEGKGVAKDAGEFVRLMTAASENGLPKAATALAEYFFERRQSVDELERAMKWLEIAAEEGDKEAMEKYFVCKKELKQKRQSK